MVNGAGWLTVVVTRITGWIDNNFVDGTVNAVAEIVEGVGARLRVIQNGKVQEYLTLAAGVVVLVAVVWIMTGVLK
jgi:NADH:ubiquinone oxidoreductase subunit 5 (subunit L)/multisubunit Na+/H+ antiporter MnhA subunit